jgi:hypothetical protein
LTSTAVLSIPSFDEYGEALHTTQTTVDEFIRRSKEAGLQEVVIDLQQNTGGQILLAIDVFRRFFPNVEPFAGSQMRAHHPTDVMGRTLTNYFDGLPTTDPDYEALIADEWVSSTRLNADTDANFTSWAEYYGPRVGSNDQFTAIVSSSI